MVATTVPALAEAAKDCRVLIWNVRERARDKWLVLDLCGNGHRNPDGVVGLEYLGIPFQTTGVGRR